MTKGLELIRVTLEGFRSFRERQTIFLNRPAGVYYVRGINTLRPRLGANGVGKTTLFMDAPYWCLFGRTIRDANPASAVQSWRHEGRTMVLTDLFLHGEPLLIRRTRNPNSLEIDDHKAGKGFRKIEQKELNELLGFSPEVMRRTMMIGQFEGDHFLDLKPDQQARMFTEILNLEIWLKSAERAQEHGRSAGRLAYDIDLQLQEQKGRQQEITDQLKSTIAAKRDWSGIHGKEIDQAQEAVRIAKERLGEAEEGLKGASKPPRKGQEGGLAPAKELDRLRGLRRSLTPEIEKANTDWSEARAVLSTARDRTGRAKKDFDQYKLTDLFCPECGQKVPKSHVEKKLKAKEDEYRAARKAEKDAAVEEGTTKAILERRNETRDDLDKDIEKQERRAATAQGETSAWNDVANIHEIVKQKEEHLRLLGLFKNPHITARNELRLKREKCDEKIEQLTQQKRRYDRRQAAYKVWASEFKEIRLSIIDDSLAELEVAAMREAENHGLRNWTIHFETERETLAGAASYGFNTLITPPGQKKPIKWLNYSGGEAQRLQLATTFGLSEVLLSRAGIIPNIEVLDEPTHHLSPEGIGDLLENLSARSRSLNRAIFVIDHQSLDRGAFDGIVTIERDKKGSRIWQDKIG